MNFEHVWSEFYFLLNAVVFRLDHFQRKKQKQIVLVNGSPRTGTTWTVAMVASVPGYHKAGNFQRDLKLYRMARQGDVIHGHDHCTDELKQLLREVHVGVVFLVRDPRDQAVSRLFHTRRNENHIWQKHLQQLSNEDGLMACIEGLDPKTFPGVVGLASITKSWQENYPEGKGVRYEDLIATPETTMASVYSHLHIEVPRPLLHWIVTRNSFQRMTVGRKFWKRGRPPGMADPTAHVRKGIVGDWKNYFTPAHVRRFKELAGDILIEFGYEKDLSW